jgi:hypothetical protein
MASPITAKPWVLALCAAVLLASAAPCFAQLPPPEAAPTPRAMSPPAPVPWSSLSSEQQRVLGPMGKEWNSLPPERQQALANGSKRWLDMSAEQQTQARERFSRWQSLPPEQRHSLHDRWQRFQALPPKEQEAVRQNYHRFQQLPPAQRQMLRQQWRNASPEQRQQMVEHAREQHAKRMEQRGGGRQPPPHPR